MKFQESILNFRNRSMVGVLNHQKHQSLCVLFINAGMITKVGPNRLYVKIARELSNEKISSFRFDYSGSGDSEKTNSTKSFEEQRKEEIEAAMDAVQKNTGIDKFILTGICSGAEEAFHYSLIDKRVVGISLIDGIYGDDDLLNEVLPIAERELSIRYYKKNLFNSERWLKLIKGRSNVFSKKNSLMVSNMIANKFKKDQKDDTSKKEDISPELNINLKDWELLFYRNVKVFFIFCEGGYAIDIFNMTIKNPLLKHEKNSLIKHELIKDVDHTFTPIWSQNLLSESMINWLKENNNFC